MPTIVLTRVDNLWFQDPDILWFPSYLITSGTISGPEDSMRGSFLELSWGGSNPINLDTGDTRTFIEDGDTMTLIGAAVGDGFKIGFGSCVGKIKPALV